MIKYSLIVLLGINTMLGQSEDKIMHTVTCMGISAATYTYLRNKKQPEFKSRFISFATTMAIGTLKEVVETLSIIILTGTTWEQMRLAPYVFNSL